MHLTPADEYQMHQVLLKVSNPNGQKKKDDCKATGLHRGSFVMCVQSIILNAYQIPFAEETLGVFLHFI